MIRKSMWEGCLLVLLFGLFIGCEKAYQPPKSPLPAQEEVDHEDAAATRDRLVSALALKIVDDPILKNIRAEQDRFGQQFNPMLADMHSTAEMLKFAQKAQEDEIHELTALWAKANEQQKKDLAFTKKMLDLAEKTNAGFDASLDYARSKNLGSNYVAVDRVWLEQTLKFVSEYQKWYREHSAESTATMEGN